MTPFRRSPIAHGAALTAILLGLLVNYGMGLMAYQQSSVTIDLVKPDWRGATTAYRSRATARSCLVIVDGLGTAAYSVVPFYLEESEGQVCFIDGRSPLLADVLAQYDDIWVAMETQWYPKQEIERFQALAAEVLSTQIESFDQIIFLHAGVGPSNDRLVPLRTVLQLALATLEPDSLRARNGVAPGVRETLANLAVLTEREIGGASELLEGFLPPIGDQDHLQWDRAIMRLERADVAGARALAIRLVALYPGNPDVYDLMADIERVVNLERANRYRALATALREQAA
jgi:hypothetical protein